MNRKRFFEINTQNTERHDDSITHQGKTGTADCKGIGCRPLQQEKKLLQRPDDLQSQ
jgi:hypothetical protein